jgi:hypothetical protein
MRDWLKGLRGAMQVEMSNLGHDKQHLKLEQKERQEMIIERLRELSAPYTYYCDVGDHNWRWELPDGVKPPGQDGENIICPEHGCKLCL